MTTNFCKVRNIGVIWSASGHIKEMSMIEIFKFLKLILWYTQRLYFIIINIIHTGNIRDKEVSHTLHTETFIRRC